MSLKRFLSSTCSRAGAFGACVVLMLGISSPARAQDWIPPSVTHPELLFGMFSHDPHFLDGSENGFGITKANANIVNHEEGVDLNPELRFGAPVSQEWAARLPAYLRWIVLARPTIGLMANTDGYTSQAYVGFNWTWKFASDVLRPGDGITGGIFFGPSFNNGYIQAPYLSRHKSLGGATLFDVGAEGGYQITPTYNLSIYFNHSSNGGFDRFNQSLNDLGLRLGVGF